MSGDYEYFEATVKIIVFAKAENATNRIIEGLNRGFLNYRMGVVSQVDRDQEDSLLGPARDTE